MAVLFAFNLELASVRERSLREAMAGHIRLQWWQEALQDKASAAPPVGDLLALGLPQERLVALIEARRDDLSPEAPATLAGLETYAEETGGALHELAALLLGAGDSEAKTARAAGTAYALQGLMRAIPVHASQGRRHLPLELFPGDISGPSAALGLAVRQVADKARERLESVRLQDMPRNCRPAALCALQARTHLKRLRRAGFNPFDGRLSLPATRPLALWWGMIGK